MTTFDIYTKNNSDNEAIYLGFIYTVLDPRNLTFYYQLDMVFRVINYSYVVQKWFC